MNDRQRAQAKRDMEWLVKLSGVLATVVRPGSVGAGSFFGRRDSNVTTLGPIPMGIRSLPPETLAEIGADAVASVLPGADVREGDWLDVDGVGGGDGDGESVRYRVTEVRPQNLFGALTHVDLHLERERRDGQE